VPWETRNLINGECGFDVQAAKNAVATGYRQVASGWHKWRRQFHIAGAAVTNCVIEESHVTSGMRVLDLACGPGESAWMLIQLVGPTGLVVGVDLVAEMLPRRSDFEPGAGRTNFTLGVADAEALPFGDRTFDAVVCRAAIMHFPNAAQALRETFRVIRPHGRAVFSALGPPENTPAIMATVGVILRHHICAPDSAPGPDIYRFGKPGALSAALTGACFRDVSEVILTVPCPWPGSAVEFWNALPDHAWRVRELLERLPPKVRQSAAAEAIAALRSYEKDGVLHLTAPIAVASGIR